MNYLTVNQKLYFVNQLQLKILKIENGQRIWIDVIPKKIYKWPINTSKIAHQLVGRGMQNHSEVP